MPHHIDSSPEKPGFSSRDGSLAMAENRLLNSLPADLTQEMRPDLKLVSFRQGEVVIARGSAIEYGYFPTTCLLSVIVALENGNSVEATTVGNEGFVGLPLVLGGAIATEDTIAQLPGEALQVAAAALEHHLQDERLRDRLGAYIINVLQVYSQSTACIAFHPVEQRLARWLLMVQDGIQQDEFPLTQEFLSIMLGVHRPTMTVAVKMLEKAGLIEHRRARIRIADRAGLERAACECYQTTRHED